jgi:mRNA interferase MazF
MGFKKGDIVVIPVPFTDNATVRKRPAIVISNAEVHATGDVLIAQITSKEKDDNLSFMLPAADMTVALPKQSYVRIHKLFVLEERLIEKKISELIPTVYSQLAAKISALIS